MFYRRYLFLILTTLFYTNCSNSKDSPGADGGQAYAFTASVNSKISIKSSVASLHGNALIQEKPSMKLATGPTLCSSVVCFTPTALTGKYYGTGFLIQSAGNGMTAYFAQNTWSDITGTSISYDFDAANPITNAGTLNCCNGTGDLSSENTYIENVIYLFGYLDATFTVSGVTSNTAMNQEFTVRFVLADDAVAGGKRGDLLLKDPSDGIFKWIDKSTSAGGIVGEGALVASRPTVPITMNTSVANWTNPFGTDKGNQKIPVIYAPVVTAVENDKFVVTESELATAGRTYNFGFDPTNFVMFPELLTADKNMIYSYVQLLSKIHLGGLPHSAQSMGVGNPAGTLLKVTGP